MEFDFNMVFGLGLAAGFFIGLIAAWVFVIAKNFLKKAFSLKKVGEEVVVNVSQPQQKEQVIVNKPEPIIAPLPIEEELLYCSNCQIELHPDYCVRFRDGLFCTDCAQVRRQNTVSREEVVVKPPVKKGRPPMKHKMNAEGGVAL